MCEMPKSLDEIYLDYNRAVRQAQTLERISAELERLADNDFAGCLRTVADGWKGENAAAYISKGRRLRQQLKTGARGLKADAAQIRAAAARIREADLYARAIAMEQD